MSTPVSQKDLLDMTVTVVSAHLQNNTVSSEDVPKVIHQTYTALFKASQAKSAEEKYVPAVSIRRSICPDYLICLEDGKKLKMLKRHLRTVYNMTPDEYREKWKLPADYPMVAPNYAVHRSKLAKEIGLGQMR